MDFESIAVSALEAPASTEATPSGTPPGKEPVTPPESLDVVSGDDDDEGGDESVAEETPPPSAPAGPLELKDGMTIRIAGQDIVLGKDGISADDLKGGGLRQRDYTKKTMELARVQREFKEKESSWEGERGQIREYLKAIFSDPQVLVDELEQRGQEGLFDKVVNARVEELLKLENMSPGERAAHERAKQLEKEIRKRDRERHHEERQRQANESKTQREVTAQRYAKTIPEAMKAAGLVIDGDRDHNSQMARMLQAELVLNHGQGVYTDEQIREAALAVADHPAAKALLKEKGKMPDKIEDLIAALGQDKLKALLKHVAGQSAGAPTAVLNVNPSAPAKKGTTKKGFTSAELFASLRK